MSTAISVDALGLGLFASLSSAWWEDNAISGEAQQVALHTSKVNEVIEYSRALFGAKADAISELLALADECGDENWDGAGAYPIDSAAVSMASQLIQALPDDVSLPEFAPEPDGSVSFDWIRSSSQLVSVSVSANRRLSFAWLDGTDKGHAVARFDGKGMPERLMLEIRRLQG